MKSLKKVMEFIFKYSLAFALIAFIIFQSSKSGGERQSYNPNADIENYEAAPTIIPKDTIDSEDSIYIITQHIDTVYERHK